MICNFPGTPIVYKRRKRSRSPILRKKTSEKAAVEANIKQPKRKKHSWGSILCTSSETVVHNPETKKDASEKPTNALTIVRGVNGVWSPPATRKKADWGSFRVGTSGYVYDHWRNVVYPRDASPKEWFLLYTRLFDTVEINNTFYRLPSAQAVDGWRSQAPPGFCYALKFSRFGTHMKRLKDPEQPISLFLERATRLGKEFLGPILVQLPPKFNLNMERLNVFLEMLPKQYRWAIEFRDSRWLCDDVYVSLRLHGVSLCIHDHEDIDICHPKVLTTNWTYIRFHGKNYRKRYKTSELEASATWIKSMLQKGLDVYVYFNNDYNGYAPHNALELRDLVYD